MGKVILEDAGKLPVSVLQVKTYIRKDTAEEDDLIETLLRGVVGYLEAETGRYYSGKTVRYTFTGSQFCRRVAPRRGWSIEIPACPVRSIVEVSYLDDDRVRQVIAPENYTFRRGTYAGYIDFADAYSPPSTYPDAADEWQIDVEAGYETPDETGTGDEPALQCPPEARAVIYMLTEHWFTNRGVETSGPNGLTGPINLAAKSVIEKLRIPW